jgi:hypothetical protein
MEIVLNFFQRGQDTGPARCLPVMFPAISQKGMAGSRGRGDKYECQKIRKMKSIEVCR